MSNKQDPSRFSVKSAFALGAGGGLVIGALIVFAIHHDGRTDMIATAPIRESTIAQDPAHVETSAPSDATTVASPELKMMLPHAMPPGSPAADSARLISGTIALDPSIARSVTGKVIVFVIARGGAGKGHPVFAKRLEVTSFPVAFSLSAQDSMMGGTPADQVSLEARIDLDGDAMTKEPGAPSVRIESVSLGARDVTLTLRPGS